MTSYKTMLSIIEQEIKHRTENNIHTLEEWHDGYHFGFCLAIDLMFPEMVEKNGKARDVVKQMVANN